MSKPAKTAGPASKGLKVISRPATFRRAGRVFSAEATVVPLSELSEDEAEAIRNDPMLVVSEVDIEAPKKP